MNFKQNSLRYASGLVVALFLVLLGSQYSSIKNGLSYMGEGVGDMVASVTSSIRTGRPAILSSTNTSSGTGVASGSGSSNLMSGSGTSYVSAINRDGLSEKYFTKINIYEIEIQNVQQLNLLYSKTQFSRNIEKDVFYSLSSDLLKKGSKISLYFDRSNIVGESIGYYNGKYLNTGFISRGKDCATSFSVKDNLALPANRGVKPTPKIDNMTGICAPLSAAYSLNNILKASSTKLSKATTSNSKGQVIWSKVYLEELTEGIGKVGDSGVSTTELIDPDNNLFYDKYFNVISKVGWGSVPKTGDKAEDKKNAENVKKIKHRNFNFNELISLYYKKKTDCSLVTFGHISNISNIYIMNGKKYIEIINTLEQGDKKHNNAPTNPGNTTFTVEDDGSLVVSHHSKEVKKEQRAYWGDGYSGFDFIIDCVTPEK